MRVLSSIAALFVLLLLGSASPAFSQASVGGGQQEKFGRNPVMEQELVDKERNTKDIEKEYNAVVKRTGSQASTTYDPWQTIRPSIPPKAKN